MAGGKQTARQKMINLMYLIFIAMLALNMSKEVLSAFGLMNEKLTESNISTDARNAAFMEGLNEKVSEQPEKYKPLKDKAVKVEAFAKDLNGYISTLKDNMIKGLEDPKQYEVMDKGDYLDNFFFTPAGPSAEGKEFLSKIDGFKKGVEAVLGDGYPAITEGIEKDFSTAEVKNKDGIKVDWLDYHYKGFPLVASLTKLTQMQADIKKTENEVLSAMLSGQLKSEVSLTNFEAIVVPEKTAFFSSESFKGKIVLGKKDKTLKAHKVIVNGKELPAESMQEGQTLLSFPAGGVGQREIEGEFQFKEGDSIITIPIKSEYAVIPKPNSAVISADKMNVVYRGVVNPMTISIPGVPNITANAPGLSKKSGSSYNMDVTNVKAREVSINVSGTLNGQKISDSKKFRIKDIPRPVGTVRGEDGAIKMTKSSLSNSTVGAILPDFDFNLKLNVSGFKIKIPGQPTVRISGSRLNGRAKSALQKAKRGESVQIFDINAKLASGSSYRVKKVSPVIVELTN